VSKLAILSVLLTPVCLNAYIGAIDFQLPELDSSCPEKNSDCRLVTNGVGFLRIKTEGTGKKTLFTAAKTYVAFGKPKITLVAAAHNAREEYFHRHQQIIEEKDVVLYEMPYQYNPTPSCRRLMNSLNFASELKYGIPNQYATMKYLPHFRKADLANEKLLVSALEEQHKDMSSTAICDVALQKLLEKTPHCKDDWTPVYCHVHSTSRYAGSSHEEKNSRRLKFIEEVEQHSDDSGSELGEWKDFIINQREAHVQNMLRDILNKENTSSIAVLYGAHHMSRFEEFLFSELGYRLEDTEWVEAFSASTPQ